MANTNNIKIGSSNPDAIMFNDSYKSLQEWPNPINQIVQKDNNNRAIPTSWTGIWQINDGWDIELKSPTKFLIKKFRIDTWGLRCIGPDPNKTFNGFKVKVTNISRLSNIVKHLENGELIDGFTEACFNETGWNVYWWPGQYDNKNRSIKGLAFIGGCVYGDNPRSFTTSSTPARAPWEIGKWDLSKDFTTTITALGTANSLSMWMFGGSQTATTQGENANDTYDESEGAYTIYDISDSPIEVSFDVVDDSKPLDITSKECWNIYKGNDILYHKDKTNENCLFKYGLVKIVKDTRKTEKDDEYYVNTYQFINNTGVTNEGGFIIPITTDIDDILTTDYPEEIIPGSTYKQWTFNCKADKNFIEYIRTWLLTHNLPIVQCNYDDLKGVFQGSNMDGEITCNFHSNGDIALDRFVEGSSITKINFNFDLETTGTITSCNTLFKSSPIKEVTTNRAFHMRDMSGAFEYCGEIEEIPEGLFTARSQMSDTIKRHNTLMTYGSIGLQWTFDGCSKLKTINSYDNDAGETLDNVIPVGNLYYAFNNCSSLTTIKYILDYNYRIESDTTSDGGNRSQNSWNQCRNITSIKIKNLNHDDFYAGNVLIEGNEYYYWPLDKESIEYLFTNARNLKEDYIPKYYLVDYPEIVQRDELNLQTTIPTITENDINGLTIYFGATKKNGENYTTEYDFYYQFNSNSYSIRTLSSYYNKLLETHPYLSDFLDNTQTNLLKKRILILYDYNCGATTGTIIERRDGSFSCSSPENNHANLYIGSVANQNVTDDMIKEINAKGWNVYVDNVIRQVN